MFTYLDHSVIFFNKFIIQLEERMVDIAACFSSTRSLLNFLCWRALPFAPNPAALPAAMEIQCQFVELIIEVPNESWVSLCEPHLPISSAEVRGSSGMLSIFKIQQRQWHFILWSPQSIGVYTLTFMSLYFTYLCVMQFLCMNACETQVFMIQVGT